MLAILVGVGPGLWDAGLVSMDEATQAVRVEVQVLVASHSMSISISSARRSRSSSDRRRIPSGSSSQWRPSRHVA